MAARHDRRMQDCRPMRKFFVLVGMPMVLALLPLVGGVGHAAGASESAPPDRATCERVTPAPQQALEIELYVKKDDKRAANDYEDKVVSEYVNCAPGGSSWDDCGRNGCLATSMVFDTWVSSTQIGRLKKQFQATGLFAKVVEMPVPGCSTSDAEGSCTPPTAP
jgi:hypothetical protein